MMTDKQKTKMLGLLKAAKDTGDEYGETLRVLREVEREERAAHVRSREADAALFEFVYALAQGDKLALDLGEIR